MLSLDQDRVRDPGDTWHHSRDLQNLKVTSRPLLLLVIVVVVVLSQSRSAVSAAGWARLSFIALLLLPALSRLEVLPGSAKVPVWAHRKGTGMACELPMGSASGPLAYPGSVGKDSMTAANVVLIELRHARNTANRTVARACR